MRIVDQGVLYDADGAPPERRSCAFTSLVALTDGSYRCSFRAAPGRDIPGGRLRIMGSADGSDWEVVHPGLTHTLDGIEGDLYAGYLAELIPGILTGSFVWVDRSDPSRSLVNPETAGVLAMRNLIADSSDGGGVDSVIASAGGASGAASGSARLATAPRRRARTEASPCAAAISAAMRASTVSSAGAGMGAEASTLSSASGGTEGAEG